MKNPNLLTFALILAGFALIVGIAWLVPLLPFFATLGCFVYCR
jgi:hypothetical protein